MAALVSGACLAQAPGGGPMEYRYWDWGKTVKRDDYQLAALRLALQKTVATHGPFKVVRVTGTYSTSRIHREIHSGTNMNVHAGPWRDQADSAPLERNILVDVPILGGLLGYRNLIIRADDAARFARIASAADLKRQVAGLGRGWIDVPVLRHNGYAVDDRGNMATLIDMLVSKRFDYLPMSVIEVESILAEYPQYRAQIALAQDIVIYYPFPTVFYVSAGAPRLAERLRAGLRAATSDGSLDRLTRQHFAAHLEKLRGARIRSFVLDNPLLPAGFSAAAPVYLHK